MHSIAFVACQMTTLQPYYSCSPNDDEGYPLSVLKVFVQIPCLNEEANLETVVATLRTALGNGDGIVILVVDDGSHDRTVDVARSSGVDAIVSHGRNRGLAAAFDTGINECVRLGADIIVNTDADGQYRGEDVLRLIQPNPTS